MATIIVSDIFGRTPALEELAGAINTGSLIVDPYEGTHMQFNTESDAYTFFSSNIGLDAYTKHLGEILTKIDSAINLVGFSVGASAIWNLSNSSAFPFVAQATCFYGSQIRYNRAILPQFPINLIFPESEKHFSVAELISSLASTPKLNIRQVAHSHGFMNKLSDNFNLQGYKNELQALSTGG